MQNGEKATNKLEFLKSDDFAPGFMLWAGMTSRIKTSPHSIDRKSKMNTYYYVDNALKPFLRKDLPWLFQGEEKNIILHQDSASSHTARYTLNFLKKMVVNLRTPVEWMPESPCATPVNCSIWGILKRHLQKYEVLTFSGLKTALKRSGGTFLSQPLTKP